MKNLSLGLLVAFATTVLSGCALYFGGDQGGGDTWNYCGADGYYQCEDDECYWVSSSCPDGNGNSGSGQGGGGFECRGDADCAAGCYCSDGGICEEAGFCTQDSDCGDGYTCDETRSSCEPSDTPTPTTCSYDSECPQGQYCAIGGVCTATCVCSDDETAVANGFGWCDETRSTCLPGQDPAGTCGGTATSSCTTGRPACPAGQVAVLVDGCFTGQCREINSCDVDPVCEHITDEASCGNRGDCADVVNGINCVNGSGQACQAGDTGCTCSSYVWASCKTPTP